MPHSQFRCNPVVADRGMGSQKDRKLRFTVVAFSNFAQSLQHGWQAEVAAERGQS